MRRLLQRLATWLGIATVPWVARIPADAGETSRRADALVAGNRVGDALRFLSAAVTAHPGAADLHLRYALLLRRNRDLAAARAELELANHQRPGRAEILAPLALVYLELGDPSRAHHAARHALVAAPGDIYAHSVLAALR